MARLLSRKTTQVLLIVLALFLAGTVGFLWAVNTYFSIDNSAIIRPEELGTWEQIAYGADVTALSWKTRYPWLAGALSLKPAAETKVLKNEQSTNFDSIIAKQAAEAAKKAGFATDDDIFIPPGRDNSVKAWDAATDPPEKIPRIIHQTWKEKTLPAEWQPVRDECAKMHPDYKYMLWTDADSREFLVEKYPWFVPIFDAYPYPIQRADAIRYFILHYYGGIYMDLDVGCLRRFDPLLRFEIVLPKTIPVGVSNDVMAAQKGHPFMDHLIHNLVTFNHRYLTHYPTVMFSTGPMFVSASYGLYVDTHGWAIPSTPANPSAGFKGIRVLPKSLYGKNTKPSEAPDAFFRHFYGSSWHANDADYLIFLRDHGKVLIFIGFCIALYGLGRGLLPRIFLLLGERSHRPVRPRRGRWISLPMVRDPRSGRFHSIAPGDYLRGTSSANTSPSARSRAKTLLDESTQTSTPPLNATAAAEALSRGVEMREQSNVAPFTSTVKVAAPRPQRLSMPMFQLREGENAPLMGEDDEDFDLGPGLNAERGDKSSPTSILHKMWDSFSSGESRPSSVEAIDNSGQSGSDLLRRGSASKSKSKGPGIFYLPAYFVGAGSGSVSASSTVDSTSTMLRINEEEGLLPSPNPLTTGDSSSSNHLSSTFGMTQPQIRSNSSSTIGFSNWAASFLPNNANLSNMRPSSPAMQKMLAGIGNLAGRTPSPSLIFSKRNSIDNGRPRLIDDLENSVASSTSTSHNDRVSSSTRLGLGNSSITMTRSSSSHGGLGGGGGRQSIDIDRLPPPPPYYNDEISDTNRFTRNQS